MLSAYAGEYELALEEMVTVAYKGCFFLGGGGGVIKDW